MNTPAMAVFGLRFGSHLSERVATRLGIALAPHEEREFEWGQHKSRPIQSVRGADVYVVASLHGDAAYSVNDKLCRLLFFLATLRDADDRIGLRPPKERDDRAQDTFTSMPYGRAVGGIQSARLPPFRGSSRASG